MICHADSPGADESEPQSSTGSKPSAVANGHRPVNSSESSVQDPKILDQTRRIAVLAARLTTAERQVAEHKRAKDSADRRWSSQHGQLQVAERDARELRRANPNIAHYMKLNKDAEHKLKSQYSELKRAKEKIAELERDLKAEKGKTTLLEAPLPRFREGARDEGTTEGVQEAF